MSGLPRILEYGGVKPRGVTCEHKQMRFTPTTSFNSYITNDIVRFWLPMVKGFWDPYKSFIEIEVEVDENDFPYGTGIQIDNSASSFISEMTLYVDSKEVERIQEYDTIAAMLHDVMYMPSDKFGKTYEGLGYAHHTSLGHSRDTRRIVVSESSAAKSVSVASQWGNNATTTNAASASVPALNHLGINCTGYIPERPLYITPKRIAHACLHVLNNVNNPTTNTNAQVILLGTSANAALTGVQGYRIPYRYSGSTVAYPSGGYAIHKIQMPTTIGYTPTLQTHTAAYQYNFLFESLDELQVVNVPTNGGGTYANPNLALKESEIFSARSWIESHRESTLWGIQNTASENFTLYGSDGYADNGTEYSTFTDGTNLNVYGSASGLATIKNTIEENYSVSSVKSNGYTQAFSEHLSNGSFEPLFAPKHPESWIHRGQFLEKPVTSNKKIFQIPIISSLFGVLIPAESYKLLPMEAFENLMIEFRLNEYAMFTSGYKENYSAPNYGSVVTSDTKPMSEYGQLQRKWKINRFEIWGEIYQFDDFINNSVSSMLESGISLSSGAWNIGPRFSLANTASVKNTWQINCGHESLKTLAFRIQSDDYKKYSFCRKHYYYSGNITSLQLKISNNYIPPQPIIGHGGNVIYTGAERSNTPFLIELHKAFNKLFNIGPTTYINPVNFAVNNRPYDISDTTPYELYTSQTALAPVSNNNTAKSLPLFHENRCVGRALYAFNLEAIPGEPDFLSGLDTAKYRPFEVLIDSETTDHTNRDSTLVFLLNFDVVYVLRAGEAPKVFGKGAV